MSLAPTVADVIVLGTGVSGLTLAHDLAAQGHRVALLDDYPTAGGNHISRDFAGCSFDVGAIFFWDDSAFLQMFPALMAQWVPVEFSIGRIAPSGRVHAYPLDPIGEILSRGPRYCAKVAADLARERVSGRPRRSAVDFARYYVGETLLVDSGLLSYLERFYGLPAEEISYRFAVDRMDWIKQNGGIRRRLSRAAAALPGRLGLAPRAPAIRCFARPRAGFAAMYADVVAELARRGVVTQLGAAIQSITREPAGFRVATARGEVTAPRLINTMPLAVVNRYLGLPLAATPASSRLTTLCVRFRGRRNFSSLILYNFRDVGRWKRLTLHSDYYGTVEGYDYLSVEVAHPDLAHAPGALFEDFRESTRLAGLFEGEMDLVGQFDTAYAYPIYDQASLTIRASNIEALSALGVESVGRQGLFDYIPSASAAVDLARVAMNRA